MIWTFYLFFHCVEQKFMVWSVVLNHCPWEKPKVWSRNDRRLFCKVKLKVIVFWMWWRINKCIGTRISATGVVENVQTKWNKINQHLVENFPFGFLAFAHRVVEVCHIIIFFFFFCFNLLKSDYLGLVLCILNCLTWHFEQICNVQLSEVYMHWWRWMNAIWGFDFWKECAACLLTQDQNCRCYFTISLRDVVFVF